MEFTDPRHATFWREATAASRCLSLGRLKEIGCFDDNEEGAQYCANAVLAGTKTATSTLAESARSYEAGDLEFVTFFDGTPVALIEITHVDQRPYSAIDEAFAIAEGHTSLSDWQTCHQRFYTHRLAQLGKPFSPDTMLLRVFFRRVYPV